MAVVTRTLGQVLRDLRKLRALSQLQLAKQAGIAERTVVMAELDRLEPHPRTRRKLAAALGVPVEALSPSTNEDVRRLLESPKVPELPEVMIGQGASSMQAGEDAPEPMQRIALWVLEAAVAKAAASGDAEGVAVYQRSLDYLRASIAAQGAADKPKRPTHSGSHRERGVLEKQREHSTVSATEDRAS